MRFLKKIIKSYCSFMDELDNSEKHFQNLERNFDQLYSFFNDKITIADFKEVKDSEHVEYVIDSPTNVFPPSVKVSNCDRIFVLYKIGNSNKVHKVYVPWGFNSEYWVDLAEYIHSSIFTQHIAILCYNDNTDKCVITLKTIKGNRDG